MRIVSLAKSAGQMGPSCLSLLFLPNLLTRRERVQRRTKVSMPLSSWAGKGDLEKVNKLSQFSTLGRWMKHVRDVRAMEAGTLPEGKALQGRWTLNRFQKVQR